MKCEWVLGMLSVASVVEPSLWRLHIALLAREVTHLCSERRWTQLSHILSALCRSSTKSPRSAETRVTGHFSRMIFCLRTLLPPSRQLCCWPSVSLLVWCGRLYNAKHAWLCQIPCSAFNRTRRENYCKNTITYVQVQTSLFKLWVAKSAT